MLSPHPSPLTPHPSPLPCQGEKRAMVNMLEEFVRMTAIQLGSLRNSLITDQHDMLFSGTEVTPTPNPTPNPNL